MEQPSVGYHLAVRHGDQPAEERGDHESVGPREAERGRRGRGRLRLRRRPARRGVEQPAEAAGHQEEQGAALAPQHRPAQQQRTG